VVGNRAYAVRADAEGEIATVCPVARAVETPAVEVPAVAAPRAFSNGATKSHRASLREGLLEIIDGRLRRISQRTDEANAVVPWHECYRVLGTFAATIRQPKRTQISDSWSRSARRITGAWVRWSTAIHGRRGSFGSWMISTVRVGGT
jgi:hypothetical protein